ncbi:acyltransferase family protein [Rhizomonospora bruguierae]|uniref:acyltransferase family protein n=1 Tax=Rhizomonospora bruguierae TaxID=1581705 RepID=UPI001BCAF240|nr:acyltransferase [Micromonospora sp. NBRC 107566]
MTALRGYAERIAERTPADRERHIDGLRALAILGVVCGHWLVGALTPGPDGGLTVHSTLAGLPWLAPASWGFQLLGLFFLVGGYSAVRALDRAHGRGESTGAWLRRRFRRLGAPVLAATALAGAALPVAAAAGVPGSTLRAWAVLFVQPLWFIAVYAVLTALTPYALRLDRRLGAWAALPMAAAVAVVDLLRYGPPGATWLGYLTVLPTWLLPYQIGVAWARGRVRRAAAWSLLLAGGALFALLVGWLRYPLSMVSVPGTARSNSNPPSLLVPALAAAQAGAAILLAAPLDRMLRRPVPWAAVAALNLAAMSVFCWHQTALVAVSAAGATLGPPLPGLTTSPEGIGWLAARLAWLPVFAAALAGLVALVRRWEAPGPTLGRRLRVLAALAALAFTAYLVTVY